jgi:hypothetical protein
MAISTKVILQKGGFPVVHIAGDIQKQSKTIYLQYIYSKNIE